MIVGCSVLYISFFLVPLFWTVRNYHYSLRNNPEERSSYNSDFLISLLSFSVIFNMSVTCSQTYVGPCAHTRIL
jgi:hypothetical protein